jgi:lipoate-protein ligase A
VAGCAQKRRGGAFLQHGSLPLELDLTLLGTILPGVPGESRWNSVGWLNRFARRPLSVDDVEEILLDTFVRQLGIRLLESAPGADEQLLAEQLSRQFYDNREWTLRGPGGATVPPCGELLT